MKIDSNKSCDLSYKSANFDPEEIKTARANRFARDSLTAPETQESKDSRSARGFETPCPARKRDRSGGNESELVAPPPPEKKRPCTDSRSRGKFRPLKRFSKSPLSPVASNQTVPNHVTKNTDKPTLPPIDRSLGQNFTFTFTNDKKIKNNRTWSQRRALFNDRIESLNDEILNLKKEISSSASREAKLESENSFLRQELETVKSNIKTREEESKLAVDKIKKLADENMELKHKLEKQHELLNESLNGSLDVDMLRDDMLDLTNLQIELVNKASRSREVKKSSMPRIRLPSNIKEKGDSILTVQEASKEVYDLMGFMKTGVDDNKGKTKPTLEDFRDHLQAKLKNLNEGDFELAKTLIDQKFKNSRKAHLSFPNRSDFRKIILSTSSSGA